ncbi:hypothetical protein PUNSTDRAFT_94002 [Punctularia strigosozonata HHB-11173 SS5]|uniref:Mitochondrial F1F0-ATP synthase g subunit n=1 Tax=Punctularia strigosozonata (strain HHB-11173) TaxID=741275 RepID=R7S2P0_PUNST|nr:uncharacterized protein PUNSTDRAFT_94002 [Punctularia strigosozonata HHB-11173 SS5]EIN03516.1 hypothetical protein PUNSTDRAFT_94002 [Punctularia strigosozonata HHB-11173 SS5]
MNALRVTARRHLASSTRRFASTSTETAQQKAQGAAQDAQAKAKDFLATANVTGKKAIEAGKKALGPLGERVGNLLGAYKQPLFYNTAVAREFLKQVYLAERLQPPTSLSAIQSAYSTLWSRASSPTYWRTIFSNGEWVKVGVYGIEAYGVFKIGEIVGRRSLVGYDLH